MSKNIPKPNKQVAARVEELLREQLYELNINPNTLTPQEISEGMHCTIAPDNSLTYYWKGKAILYVTPEVRESNEESSVLWRMFTKDDMFTSNQENNHENT